MYFTSTFSSYLFTDKYYEDKNVQNLIFENPFFNVDRHYEPSDCGFGYDTLLEGLTKISKQMPNWVTQKFYIILDLDHFKSALNLPKALKVPHLYVTVKPLIVEENEEDTSYIEFH